MESILIIQNRQPHECGYLWPTGICLRRIFNGEHSFLMTH